MSSCPNCGNYWNATDPENAVLAEAGQRHPIMLVDFVNQEMNLSIMKLRCTACSSLWTGTYKKGRLQQVDIWHLVDGVKPKHGG